MNKTQFINIHKIRVREMNNKHKIKIGSKGAENKLLMEL